jgi:hypothetical protein
MCHQCYCSTVHTRERRQKPSIIAGEWPTRNRRTVSVSSSSARMHFNAARVCTHSSAPIALSASSSCRVRGNRASARTLVRALRCVSGPRAGGMGERERWRTEVKKQRWMRGGRKRKIACELKMEYAHKKGRSDVDEWRHQVSPNAATLESAKAQDGNTRPLACRTCA